MNERSLESRLAEAAMRITDADALMIGAGAGMGVDSGLPDFRGNEGFWNAYPPFRSLGLSFVDLANPAWFTSDPGRAWGFYGHRLHLYREKAPHAGFAILRRWAESMKLGYFVFTSNVDGHFQQAGFDSRRILECHGSIHDMQCSRPCTYDIWPSDGTEIEIDTETFIARPPLPTCRHCDAIARPNILMFGDGYWLDDRSEPQWQFYRQWQEAIRGRKLVVVECGAGTAIPSVRHECHSYGGTLIRINPREPQVPPGQIGLPLGALDGLARIDEFLESR